MPGENRTTRSWFRRWWAALMVLGTTGVVVAFLTLSWWIRIEAARTADEARQQFGGDRIEALATMMESALPLRERNRAVWALGQLRDPRALPVLQRHYTGGPCDHVRHLCQDELRKAIALCKGEGGPPRWLSRLVTGA